MILGRLSNGDCSKNDRNILYHAAPSSGNCYDLDGQTGAFFYNTAGYLFSSGTLLPPTLSLPPGELDMMYLQILASSPAANKDIGCNGDSIGLRGGACMEKGDFKSVVFR